jgi:hypothetical protein
MQQSDDTAWYISEVDDRGASHAEPPAVREARRRFGGLDVPSSMCGTLVALALFAILEAITLAIVAPLAHAGGAQGGRLSPATVTFLTSALVVFVAFLVGGWAAARMARYTGPLNGLLVVVWFLLIAAATTLLAQLGASRSSGTLGTLNADVATWLRTNSHAPMSILAGLGLVAVMFLAAILGGALGQRMHRKADALISSESARPGAADVRV